MFKKNFLINLFGFTLMEIIIVVIIVAALAGLALPRMATVVERSVSGEGVQIITALLGAQKRYQMENGAYTAVLANLDITIPASNNFNAPTIAAADPLATIERNTASYTLSINANGTITCIPSPGICTKLGY